MNTCLFCSHVGRRSRDVAVSLADDDRVAAASNGEHETSARVSGVAYMLGGHHDVAGVGVLDVVDLHGGCGR